MSGITEMAVASLASGTITGGCAWQAIRVHIKYLAENQRRTDKKVEALAEKLQTSELRQDRTKSRLEILAENLQREGQNGQI